MHPSGEIGQQSAGVIHLTNSLKPVFRVTEFNPPRNWNWVGRFLWLTVIYDHQFEPLDAEQTKLTFIVEAKGFGASILGRLFARIYRSSLERAIPLLIADARGRGGNKHEYLRRGHVAEHHLVVDHD